MAPRWPQDGPTMAQDGPRWLPEAIPEGGIDDAAAIPGGGIAKRMAQYGAKMVQYVAKIG